MNALTFFVAIALLAVTSGCGTQTGTGAKAQLSTSIRNASSTTPAAGIVLNAMRASSPAGFLDRLMGQTVGQTTATSLSSMKYNVTQISLCQDLTVSGTAFTGEQGCISVYNGDIDNPAFQYSPSSDYSNLADAARNDPSAMTDLMSVSARSGLTTTTPLTSQNIGSYKYGIITWFPVVEVTGDITVGSTVYRTADGSVSGAPNYRTTTASNVNFTTATTDASAAVVLDNGGNWFAFQNPFVITAADISSGTSFAVDLTFNPDGLMRAFPASLAPQCPTCNLIDGAGNAMEIPELGLVPVARHATDTTMKEVYQGSIVGQSSVSSATDNFDLRIELYYVSSDPARTIYGTNIRVLPNANTNTYVFPFPTISFLGTDTDGNLNFQIYNKTVVLDEFTRGKNVGDTATVTIDCGSPGAGLFNFAGCSGSAGDPSSVSVSLTLTSISSLE